MSSSLSISQSETSSQPSITELAELDGEPFRSLSRVRIQLEIDAEASPVLHATILNLVERYVPGVPRFVISEDSTLILRLRHSDIRVLQTDQLACRLARLKGVLKVDAEHRRTGEGIVYSARVRGR